VELGVPVGKVELMANDQRGRRSGVATFSVGADELAVATVRVSAEER